MDDTEATLAAALTETLRREAILQEHGADAWTQLPTEVVRSEDIARTWYEIPLKDVVGSRENVIRLRGLYAMGNRTDIFYRLTGDLK